MFWLMKIWLHTFVILVCPSSWVKTSLVHKQRTTSATIGYMPPEYGLEGIVSTSGDVYSYGILLMEIFTRKKPRDEMFSSEMSFRSWVNDDLHGSLFQVVDTNLLVGEDEHLPAR